MPDTLPDRILRVDLSEREVQSEPIPTDWRRQFVGGKGLGARFLYEELDPGTDPLGPDNRLMFLLGPLTGRTPGEPRYAAVTKSPLTGTFLDSYAGGSVPERLAGTLSEHLGIIVQGTAAESVRVEVAGDTASIHPSETWGKGAAETAEAFEDAAVACVGPAGENQVAYATIASDGGDHHAGRGGAGAVMGAKRLKAVVIRGDPLDSDEIIDESEAERFRTDATGRWLAASDTVESVDYAHEVGALATRGWTEGQFDAVEDVGVEAVREAATERERADDPVPGGFRVETEEGDSVPRGATSMSLGAGLGIDSFDAVATLGERCNRAGIDVISAGSAVAWAIRAAETGVIDRELAFGDETAARDLLDEIISRDTALGDALAAGVAGATKRFGGENLVPTVKAMELPSYDPRGAESMALAYATSDRGACHRRARPIEREPLEGQWSPERAASAVIHEQNRRSALWSLIVDDFAGEALADMGAGLLAARDLDYEPSEISAVGERTWTLTRLFNVREGFERADDELPAALEVPLDDGPAAGNAIHPDRFEAMLDAYYANRGWGPTGRPTTATVERLGLGDVVDSDTALATDPASHSSDAD